MHSRENWDDLRYVLAVAEQGSVYAGLHRSWAAQAASS